MKLTSSGSNHCEVSRKLGPCARGKVDLSFFASLKRENTRIGAAAEPHLGQQENEIGENREHLRSRRGRSLESKWLLTNKQQINDLMINEVKVCIIYNIYIYIFRAPHYM